MPVYKCEMFYVVYLGVCFLIWLHFPRMYFLKLWFQTINLVIVLVKLLNINVAFVLKVVQMSTALILDRN